MALEFGYELWCGGADELHLSVQFCYPSCHAAFRCRFITPAMDQKQAGGGKAVRTLYIDYGRGYVAVLLFSTLKPLVELFSCTRRMGLCLGGAMRCTRHSIQNHLGLYLL